MSGEIEKPLSISFQADAFQSGSVSFGRFEKESLSWERRSSFSHNRYLEEVEKCSKPGSVIQKKAYFEAHFRKKGMLPFGAPISPGEPDHQTGENDVSDEGWKDEGDSVSRRGSYSQLDESTAEYAGQAVNSDSGDRGSPGDQGNGWSQSDDAVQSNNHVYHGESTGGSEYLEDPQTIDIEKEDYGAPSTGDQEGAASSSSWVLVDSGADDDVNPPETHKGSEPHFIILPSEDDEQVIEVKDHLRGSEIDIDVSTKVSDSRIESSSTAKVGERPGHHQNRSSKPKDVEEKIRIGPRRKSQANVSRLCVTSPHVPNASPKVQTKRLKDTLGRSKAEKQSLQGVGSVKSLVSKEASLGPSARADRETMREKEPRAKKTITPQLSASKKIELPMHQTTSRLNNSTNVTKPERRPSSAGFNFRSVERAERRKEYSMKVGERAHAKEAEMCKIQAKIQEKTEAEIKQLRKSLKFKATPLPSFYNSAARPGLRNKPPSIIPTTSKAGHRSTNPVSGVVTTSQSGFKTGNRRSINGCVSPEATRKSEFSTGKQREEKDDAHLQRARVPERSKASNDDKVGGQPKAGARRSTNLMVRKSMRRIGIGGNSGMQHLEVGVAS